MSTQLPNLPKCAGSFEAYLSYVNSLPTLDEKQERDLFTDYQENNDLNAVQKIVLSHLKFVAHITRNYKGYGLPLEDLMQEGTVGLMKSVKKFNLAFGVRLSSFAIHYIKSEIHEYVIRNWRLVKATTTKSKRKLFFNLRRLKAKHEWLTYRDKQDIANQLNVDQEAINEMEVQLAQSDLSINSPPSNNGDENNLFHADILLEDKSECFTTKLIQQDLNDKALNKLKGIVASLEERSRDIVENRWLSEVKLTHSFFSKKYDVSPERIRQIEEKAILTIQHNMGIFHNKV